MDKIEVEGCKLPSPEEVREAFEKARMKSRMESRFPSGVTTLQDYSHYEGHMTQQCVIFASKERVKQLLKPYVHALNYDATVAILVEAGILVVPVIGLFADGFNSEISDMADMKEDSPGLCSHGEPIMSLEPLANIHADGKRWLKDQEKNE
jgi:hypothetical protein